MFGGRACLLVALSVLIMAVLLLFGPEGGATSGDWPHYSGDLLGRRYSRLKQVHRDNVTSLTARWSFPFQKSRDGHESQATPLAVDGKIFLPAGREVVCLEGSTGTPLWRRSFEDGNVSHRGLAYWPGDSRHGPRVLFTVGRELVALEAGTGRPAEGFGEGGKAPLRVPYQGVPTIFDNVVVVGSNVADAPQGEPGNPAAYDAVSGAELWNFQTVLQEESSWGSGWKDRSGTNVWAFSVTVDPEYRLVYIPVAAPADDFWGGDRPGSNLYSDSLVALDIHSGEYRWHFQTVHHDLWNFDLPAPPTLVDIPRAGGPPVRALALAGKAGYLYLLDRLTGQPIFEVEETPVPAGDVPGEWYAPTQPIPTRPPPLCRTGFTRADLVSAQDTTPEHAAAALRFWRRHGGLSNSGPFTPFRLKTGSDQTATIQLPGSQGGVNWGGLGLDPSSGRLFCNAKNSGLVGFIEADPGKTPPYKRVSVDGPQHRSAYVTFKDAKGNPARLPCLKPPWGSLVAVDSRTGEIAWQSPLGLSECLPPEKQLTGLSLNAGPLVTAGGLVFIGATLDRRFRAFDSETGRELWAWELGAPAEANPMTYLVDGKQYLAVVAGNELFAFTLGAPSSKKETVSRHFFRDSMNIYRRYQTDPRLLKEFYSGVLSLKPLPDLEVNGEFTVYRHRLGDLEVKFTSSNTGVPGPSEPPDRMTGLRLFTFFFADESRLVNRLEAHGYPSVEFSDTQWEGHPARVALLQDPGQRWVELVVIPGASRDQLDAVEVGITVSDLEAGRAYYRDILGLEELAPRRDPRLDVMRYPFRAGKTTVALRQFGQPLPEGSDRGGIQYVVSNLEAVRSILTKNGVNLDREVQVMGVKSLWTRDPDGVTNYFAETPAARSR